MVTRKSLEILDPVIASEAICVRRKELSRSSRVNKTLTYFWLMPLALDEKIEQQQNGKKALYCDASPERSVCWVSWH